MGTTQRPRRKVILIGIVATILIGLIIYGSMKGDGRTAGNTQSTYAVTRGDLVMSVIESGTIKALNAVEIKSEVEGNVTIVSLVPEGTFITEEDVANGKLLVELDSSEKRDRLNVQEIAYNSAEADYTQSRESLAIQENQNDSDIQQGVMNVKFGRMDLEKYLGKTASKLMVEMYETDPNNRPDITALISDPNQLGGASLQSYRNLESKIKLAKESLKQAQDAYVWSKKLYDKQYESRSAYETAQLKVERLKVELDQSKTSLDLFIQYEFPKQSELLFSKFLESERELERIHARARSKLAQETARLNSTRAKYELNKEKLQRIQTQIRACTIKAPSPGLVIYASSHRGRFGGSRTHIEVGEDIREREEIMTLTNTSEMAVELKVHETNVDKIKVGQEVKITVDAHPDKVFKGQVLTIAPLPEPQHFLANPDLIVYSTDVSLADADNLVKPGMSARAEIVIAELEDVLSVPIQSVANRSGQKVCFIADGTQPKEQLIQTGAYNDRFIQVTDGLEQGQQILLVPPRLLMPVSDKPDGKPAQRPAGAEGRKQKPPKDAQRRPGAMAPKQKGNG
ncbi:MAG: efflux RND transporter periplasmic adaptor subunit [Planctomycetota bacterium]|jgi:HlyD family secretion protein